MSVRICDMAEAEQCGLLRRKSLSRRSFASLSIDTTSANGYTHTHQPQVGIHKQIKTGANWIYTWAQMATDNISGMAL